MKWRSALGVWCNHRKLNKLKGRFYKIAIWPAMVYGTECWDVKKQHIHKLSVAQMRMLRWISGNTQKDRIRNKEILIFMYAMELATCGGIS